MINQVSFKFQINRISYECHYIHINFTFNSINFILSMIKITRNVELKACIYIFVNLFKKFLTSFHLIANDPATITD